MRVFFLCLLLYAQFLIQMVACQYLKVWPDFMLITILVVALHDTRLVTTLVGTTAGFLLDLVIPSRLGTNMLVLGLLGYASSTARNYFYPAAWLFPLIVISALVIQRVATAIHGIPTPLRLQIISVVLTVGTSLPLRSIIKWAFYRPRQTV